MKHNFKYFCKEPESIENYEKAKADNFKGWNCHHRKGVELSREELKALGMYYDRPADELIFLKISEHTSLHMKGKHNPNYGKQFSEETRKKLSDSWDYDKHFTAETRKKISEAQKVKRFSEEHRKKLSEAAKGKHKGMHWYNNGKECKFCFECPDGFVPGRIKKPRAFLLRAKKYLIT